MKKDDVKSLSLIFIYTLKKSASLILKEKKHFIRTDLILVNST